MKYEYILLLVNSIAIKIINMDNVHFDSIWFSSWY
jgi:hypothetical protein